MSLLDPEARLVQRTYPNLGRSIQKFIEQLQNTLLQRNFKLEKHMSESIVRFRSPPPNRWMGLEVVTNGYRESLQVSFRVWAISRITLILQFLFPLLGLLALWLLAEFLYPPACPSCPTLDVATWIFLVGLAIFFLYFLKSLIRKVKAYPLVLRSVTGFSDSLALELSHAHIVEGVKPPSRTYRLFLRRLLDPRAISMSFFINPFLASLMQYRKRIITTRRLAVSVALGFVQVLLAYLILTLQLSTYYWSLYIGIAGTFSLAVGQYGAYRCSNCQEPLDARQETCKNCGLLISKLA